MKTQLVFYPKLAYNGAWICQDTKGLTKGAIYEYQSVIGNPVFVVSWFLKNDEGLPEELHGKENRFLTYEEAEQYIIESAPLLGFKLIKEHMRVIL